MGEVSEETCLKSVVFLAILFLWLLWHKKTHFSFMP